MNTGIRSCHSPVRKWTVVTIPLSPEFGAAVRWPSRPTHTQSRRMKALHERTCAGLALTASYWALPSAMRHQGSDPVVSDPVVSDPVASDPVVGAAIAAEIAAVAAALSVRCAHPVYLPRQRRAARGRRA